MFRVMLLSSGASHHSVSFFAFLTATVDEATDIPLRSLLKSKGCPRLPRMPTELTSLGSKSTCMGITSYQKDHASCLMQQKHRV